MKKGVLSCGVLLILCLCLPLQATVSQTAGVLIREGLSELKRGEFRAAEEHLSAALKSDPELAEVRADLGLAYYGNHKYLQAVKQFQLALKQNPALKNVTSLLPLSLAAIGRCTEAEPQLRREFTSSSSDNLRRLSGLSLQQCLVQSGNKVEAERITQSLLERYPNDGDVLYQAGQLYGELSSDAYIRLMHVAPHSARAYQAVAGVASAKGSWKEAINDLRQALKVQPDLRGAHLQIATLLLTHTSDANTWRNALDELNDELRVSPTSAQAEYEIGEVYRKHDQLKLAIAAFRRSLRLDPRAVPARLGLAKTLRQLGSHQEALLDLLPAEQVAPHNAAVHFLLAQLYQEVGKPEQAQREMAAFELWKTRGVTLTQSAAAQP